MVSDVIEFSTNQKTVNSFLVFQRYLGNGKGFLDEFFCIAFRKFFRIFYNRVSTNRTPSKAQRAQFKKHAVVSLFIFVSVSYKGY